MKTIFLVTISVWLALVGTSVQAAELVMIEEDGCVWCARWNQEIAPIYPKTAAGKFAPLRRFDKNGPFPDTLKFSGKFFYTPTFVVIENGAEIGRIEGYPGEDFFWGLLEKILSDFTSFPEVQS
ncbi:MAG: hypothetical protein KUG69_07465 [Marinosulfonomonas sp.]|nr:hypothetical protein [Marinosulfonomonas sp.]